MKEIIDTYCGLSCKECEYREKNNCKGCIATKGKPFHGECKVAECAKNKRVGFCGECADFPCKTIEDYSNDEEHGDNPKGARIERCKQLKKMLVDEAREGINPVSYCGHHCDYCFLGEWCGGCRSNYNCCSYATIFEDKKCPNVECASSKKINGCYECTDLENCKKGYYSNENEYIAKASAIFIKKYGTKCYTEALKKAIKDGVNYPKTFDESGSVDASIKILEKYL